MSESLTQQIMAGKIPRLHQLLLAHDSCRKAFFQAPTPRLGQALKMIEASIRWERSQLKKGK